MEVRFRYVTEIFQDASEKSNAAQRLPRPDEHDALAHIPASETHSIFHPRMSHGSVDEFKKP